MTHLPPAAPLRHRTLHWTRGLALGLVVLALQACTGIQLGYNNSVNLAVWWLNGYVDLDAAQSQQLRDDLRPLLQRHRQQSLPVYVQTLQQVQTWAPGDLAADQVCAVGDTLRGYVDSLLRDAEPAATALVRSLSPAQITALERKYSQTNAEYRSDWLAPPAAERQQKRYDKALERAETAYGRLDPAQKTLLRQHTDNPHFDPQQVLAERMQRQADTVRTLRLLHTTQTDSAEARAAVLGLLHRATHSPRPAYRAYAEAQNRQDCQGLAALHNSTTPAQRAAAVRWLGGYVQSLQALAAQR